jgi:PKD domain
VGEEVTFVSYSDDRDGHITEQAWDLDADGTFDDAKGPLVTRSFSTAGQKTVTLRVTDDAGAASKLSVTLAVHEPPPPLATGSSPPPVRRPVIAPKPLPPTLSPFPIVRLVGSLTEVGTQINLLTVRAPKGARATVRCRGRGCPVSRRAKKVSSRAPVRFDAFKRVLPAGVVLEVLVSRGKSIGKFTRFKLRQNRRPQRVDGCLWPHTTRMAPCPEA